MGMALTPELQEMVDERIQRGHYDSASDVVREALKLLKERDKLNQSRLAELQREIAIGLEQAEDGEVRVYDERGLSDLCEKIKLEGRKWLTERLEERLAGLKISSP